MNRPNQLFNHESSWWLKQKTGQAVIPTYVWWVIRMMKMWFEFQKLQRFNSFLLETKMKNLIQNVSFVNFCSMLITAIAVALLLLFAWLLVTNWQSHNALGWLCWPIRGCVPDLLTSYSLLKDHSGIFKPYFLNFEGLNLHTMHLFQSGVMECGGSARLAQQGHAKPQCLCSFMLFMKEILHDFV